MVPEEPDEFEAINIPRGGPKEEHSDSQAEELRNLYFVGHWASI